MSLRTTLLAASAAVGSVTLLALTGGSPAMASSSCRSEFARAGGGGGVLVVQHRHVTCTERTRLMRRALSKGANFRYDGFTCRYEDVQAGGGATACRRGTGYVLIGFE